MTPINIFLMFLPSSAQFYQVSFCRNSFRNRFQLHFSNSTGFDVAKTGDARIGFVGKSSEMFWKAISACTKWIKNLATVQIPCILMCTM